MKTMQSLNKPVILFDIDYTLFNTAQYKESNQELFSLYKEVYDVLSELSNTTILGIFSEGESEFQNRKLRKTKIDHFFSKEHIHIEHLKSGKIKALGEIYKNTPLYIIDDKLPFLLVMKNTIPQVKTIWIKRGLYAENQNTIPGFTPDAVIDNLSELIPIINNL